MRRAGFSETRSHPPLKILLKPTSLEAGSPPAWRITTCYAQFVIQSLLFQIFWVSHLYLV